MREKFVASPAFVQTMPGVWVLLGGEQEMTPTKMLSCYMRSTPAKMVNYISECKQLNKYLVNFL